jgi:hypothetical protein
MALALKRFPHPEEAGPDPRGLVSALGTRAVRPVVELCECPRNFGYKMIQA